jgi:hypothetical protein
MSKTLLFDTTLICIDTTPKVRWALEAIYRSLREIEVQSVKLLTDQKLPISYAIQIPKLNGLEAYSKFCMRELHRYVDSKHCLLIQSDGFVVDGRSWTDEFYHYDFGGAPFQPSNLVGNGGFSWRSKRLLEACSKLPEGADHPEDAAICVRHRSALEAQGMKFMPVDLARQFSFEGRSWNTKEWSSVPNKWRGQFGFHSLLSVLPPEKKPCRVFHHSLDQGDLIYGCAAIKALGGGALFISPDNKFPYPLNSRWARMGGEAATVDNLRPLLEAQDYIHSCRYTHGTPFSTDYDLNRFRIPWRQRTAKDYDSILKLHMDAFGLPMPSTPWLTISNPIATKPIVVNRTARYQNLEWPWTRFIEKFHTMMVFVGTEQECELFRGFAPRHKFDYYPTANALELARVIAGAKWFVGNQSLPLAIAHGLHKPVVVEEWPANANCRIQRPNAFYDFPKSWLK